MAHILIIDDDAPILRLLRLFFTSCGHTVTATTQSPLEMIKTLAEPLPDLIFLDLMFGNDPEGWQAAQTLKATPQTRDIPILLCSAANRQVDSLRESAPIIGIEIVLKPFDLEHVEASINKALLNARALTSPQQ